VTACADMVVRPCAAVRGILRVPGDKSISHRAAMLGALAEGETVIEGFLESDDCLGTLNAMAALGAPWERRGGRIAIRGVGGRPAPPSGPLDLGNSGTGLRLLAGIAAGQPFVTEFTGDASLRSRPMGRIKEPLERMGAGVELLGPGGTAPLLVRGGALTGIRYRLPVASAQVKSCVLLAGLFARGPTTVEEPRRTRDHTERLLEAMGVGVRREGDAITVEGAGPRRPRLAPAARAVPGDFSSAAFWMAAAAAREGCEVRVEGVGLNPGRTAFLEVLRRMGAEVNVAAARGADSEWEPRGDVTVRGGRLDGTEVGGDEIPNLIDELPLVAVLGAMAAGRTVIRDAAELRVKESDRIRAMAAGLAAFGVPVEETPDGMIVSAPAVLRGGGEVHSRGDHRVAMALAVLALAADAPVRVRDVACVDTSYPGFWDDLERLRG